ncbi:MAG: hypothetical protein AAFQ08_02525, partial [Bacteroidota bacterium]
MCPPKTDTIPSRLPIHAFEQELIVLQDGSVAIGYCVQGFEDEAQPEATYQAFTQTLAHTIRQFPVGTVLQKIDTYYGDTFSLPPLGKEASFWQQQQALHYQHYPILKHQSWLYLIVGAPSTVTPQLTCYARGKALLEAPFAQLGANIKAVQQCAQELEAVLSDYWTCRKLTAQENLRGLYAYFNLDYVGKPTGFEHTIAHSSAGLQIGHKQVQVVSMSSQTETPAYCAKNRLGHGEGVTVPFLWPLTHYLPFPHLTVQIIRLLDTEPLMARWSEELAWSEGATTQARSERQAQAACSAVAAFDQAIKEREEVLVEMALEVILYSANVNTLGEQVEKTKSAIKRLGMQPLVESYDTANLFFACQPGVG